MTDYHCHIFPDIDDGSKSPEISRQMLDMQKAQGVKRIVATPHFYSHKEKSVAEFLEKRQSAVQMLPQDMNFELHLGAEISVEGGISELKDIEQLAFTGSKLILFEFPYAGFADWQIAEIENICAEFHLFPMIAHPHRYLDLYEKGDIEKILQLDAVFQINNEAFLNFRERNFVKRLIRSGRQFCFASDCHNITNRQPNFNVLLKRFRNQPEVLEQSHMVWERFKK